MSYSIIFQNILQKEFNFADFNKHDSLAVSNLL